MNRINFLLQVRFYLEQVAALQHRGRSPGVRPPAQFVLDHGETFTYDPARPAPDGPWEPKSCFKNAWQLAEWTRDLSYVEGWAAGPLPVEHAWCVTGDGTVVDPTWPHEVEEREYVGVRLDRDKVRGVLLETGVYGVLCNAWQLPSLRRAGGLLDLVESVDTAAQ